MEILCIDSDVDGLTKNKRYKAIEKKSPYSIYEVGFLIINDFGVEKWYSRCPFGIIKIVKLTNKFIQYIGKSKCLDLTFGGVYEILDRGSSSNDNEYYYFINDKGNFVGINRRSMNGSFNFMDITKKHLRKNKLDELFS